jgi:hypothetical protein
MAMGKPATTTFAPGVHTGKLTVEKLSTIKDSWVRWLSKHFPEKDIATIATYTYTSNPSAKGGEGNALPDEVIQSHVQTHTCV